MNDAEQMLSVERDAIRDEFSPPFVIKSRELLTTPVVLCSPHSGRVYPRHFLDQSPLDPKKLRKSEDCLIDDLFTPAAAQGAPLIAAQFPRAYLDVNREPFELDPRLFDEPLPEYANQHTTRVAGGLGTIARIVADGEEIYRRSLPLSVAFERINCLYRPFHAALDDLLQARHNRFGYAVLLDCHSMPSASMAPGREHRPDIVLGDCFGASCHPGLTALIKNKFEHQGYEVQINRPYAGGYITEHYGRPAEGQYAIQIEINRGLYLNETRLEPTQGYAALRHNLTAMVQQVFCELPALFSPPAAAAE